MSGLFVVFEGGDGVGKSHHERWLADWLTERGVEVVRTFEPGDTGLGRRIREIVPIDLPRPRSADVRASKAFADHLLHLESLIFGHRHHDQIS